MVRAVDAADLRGVGSPALVANALHLSTQPGSKVIERLGGLHGFMGWDRPIVTDSGGFQLYSLLRENDRFGTIGAQGFIYRPGGKSSKKLFSPEKAIAYQARFGADVMFCLDQCTHADDPAETQRQSVARTIDWARRCRTEFDRMHARRGGDAGARPRLFAVVQGGDDADLRRHCAEALAEIGFDGYGFGGWPVADDGRLTDMVGRVAELLPSDVPLHALGVGKPENIVAAHDLGYSTFDSALPTRDGRRRRLFVPTQELTPRSVRQSGFYRYLHIGDDRYRRDADPVDPSCDCPCCRQVSRGYLHHLFNVEDSLALRLATLHNLRFVNRLAEVLGASG